MDHAVRRPLVGAFLLGRDVAQRENMIDRGYDPVFAKNCFEQIKGFGSYGFPESHTASFAQLVYVSSWLKHFHPDAFCCGLLNSQPMGFYAPAQIVGDARKNGVDVRPIDVSYSFAQNTLEERTGAYHAVRLGFRQIDGFKWADPDEEKLKRDKAKRLLSASSPRRRGPITPEVNQFPKYVSDPCKLLVLSQAERSMRPCFRGDDEALCADDWANDLAARQRRPFTSMEDFARHGIIEARTGAARRRGCVPLARARSPRGVWAVRRLPDDVPLPLFESATARELPDERAAPLRDAAA